MTKFNSSPLPETRRSATSTLPRPANRFVAVTAAVIAGTIVGGGLAATSAEAQDLETSVVASGNTDSADNQDDTTADDHDTNQNTSVDVAADDTDTEYLDVADLDADTDTENLDVADLDADTDLDGDDLDADTDIDDTDIDDTDIDDADIDADTDIDVDTDIDDADSTENNVGGTDTSGVTAPDTTNENDATQNPADSTGAVTTTSTSILKLAPICRTTTAGNIRNDNTNALYPSDHYVFRVRPKLLTEGPVSYTVAPKSNPSNVLHRGVINENERQFFSLPVSSYSSPLSVFWDDRRKGTKTPATKACKAQLLANPVAIEATAGGAGVAVDVSDAISGGVGPYTFTTNSRRLSETGEPGIFTYTPRRKYTGEHRAKIHVTDSNGTQGKIVVHVTVSAANHPPAADDLTFTGDEDAALTGRVEYSDLDGIDDLSLEIGNGPAHGSITMFDPSDGAFTYQPSDNWYGTDAFDFIVTDPAGESAVGSVTLSVLPVNDAPILDAPEPYDVSSTSASDTINASDVDGDELIFSITQQPTNGTVMLSNDGNWTYTAANDCLETTDFFVVAVTDPSDATAEAAVQLSGTCTAFVQIVPVVDINGNRAADTGEPEISTAQIELSPVLDQQPAATTPSIRFDRSETMFELAAGTYTATVTVPEFAPWTQVFEFSPANGDVLLHAPVSGSSSISGTVLYGGDSRQPAANAVVEVTWQNDTIELRYEVATDLNGIWSVDSVPNGVFSVTVGETTAVVDGGTSSTLILPAEEPGTDIPAEPGDTIDDSANTPAIDVKPSEPNTGRGNATVIAEKPADDVKLDAVGADVAVNNDVVVDAGSSASDSTQAATAMPTRSGTFENTTVSLRVASPDSSAPNRRLIIVLTSTLAFLLAGSFAAFAALKRQPS